MISRQNGRTSYDNSHNTHYFCNKLHLWIPTLKNPAARGWSFKQWVISLFEIGCFIPVNSLPIRTFASTCGGQVPLLPWAAQVQPLLQLYCTMYLHVFGTGGSVESLATRYFLLSTKICWWRWYLRFILDALSSDQVLILGSSNVCLQTICSRMPCLKRVPLVDTSCRFHGVHCSTGALCIFSCLKSPTPGTTILLSSGAWAISYLESRSESFCLLQRTAGKSFQFCGSDTFLP